MAQAQLRDHPIMHPDEQAPGDPGRAAHGHAEPSLRRSEKVWLGIWGGTCAVSATAFALLSKYHDKDWAPYLSNLGGFAGILGVLGAGVAAVFTYRTLSFQRRSYLTSEEAARLTAKQNETLTETLGSLKSVSKDYASTTGQFSSAAAQMGAAAEMLVAGVTKTEQLSVVTTAALNSAIVALGKTSEEAAKGLQAAVGDTKELTRQHQEAAGKFMQGLSQILEDRQEEQRLRKESAIAVRDAHQAIANMQNAQRALIEFERVRRINEEFFQRRMELRRVTDDDDDGIEAAYGQFLTAVSARRQANGPLPPRGGRGFPQHMEDRSRALPSLARKALETALDRSKAESQALRRCLRLLESHCAWCDRYRNQVDDATYAAWLEETAHAIPRELLVLAAYKAKFGNPQPVGGGTLSSILPEAKQYLPDELYPEDLD